MLKVPTLLETSFAYLLLLKFHAFQNSSECIEFEKCTERLNQGWVLGNLWPTSISFSGRQAPRGKKY